MVKFGYNYSRQRESKGLEFDSKTDINIQTDLHSQSKIGFMYSCFIHKKEDG